MCKEGATEKIGNEPNAEIEESYNDTEGYSCSSACSFMTVSNKTRHVLHCCLFLFIICLMEYLTIAKPKEIGSFCVNPWENYGIFFTCVLYGLRLITLLPLPQAIFNFAGMIFYNTFPKKVVFRSSPLLSPLICIRVVTKGDYPQLVKDNVARNMKTCLETGLENFYIEVVTDKPLNLPCSPRIRELVISEGYKTSSGSLYKSRALQYCLEEKINRLSDDDWIIHLDEETLLTSDCIRGILNFAIDGKYDIGQGLITYANEEIVNWFTTLADGFRVADDMGKLRLQFKFFHKPLFSFKGSYVVTKFGTEKAVNFDNGPDGSIAEDCYFAIKAFSKGYTFDFIEGEMWEKSPFTLKDFIQQRKRWLQGILLVVHSKALPWKYKILLAMSCYAWVTMPLAVSNIIFVSLFPLSSILPLDILVSFVAAVNIYMFIFGTLKSSSIKRYGVFKYLLCLIGSVAIIPLNVLLEITVVVWGYFGSKHVFYIVQKSTNDVV